MAGRNSKKCPYVKCYLPDNNNKYLLQLIYLSISFLLLLKDENKFTFFSILMYTAPILIDLITCDIPGTKARWFRIVFIVINSIVCFISVLGLAEVLEDNGAQFCICQTYMVLPGLSFPKKCILFPMASSLGIPLMMFVSNPTQRSKQTIVVCQSRKGGV